jgi:hypothetical protein
MRGRECRIQETIDKLNSEENCVSIIFDAIEVVAIELQELKENGYDSPMPTRTQLG